MAVVSLLIAMAVFGIARTRRCRMWDNPQTAVMQVGLSTVTLAIFIVVMLLRFG